MKIYKADNELEDILLKRGFIDTTSQRDKGKGKKSFKKSKQARKEIYFDYINIVIWNRSVGQDNFTSLSQEELRLVLLFFEMNTVDFKELSYNGEFNLKKVANRLSQIRIEQEELIKFNIKKSRINKLQRILDIYRNIKIE